MSYLIVTIRLVAILIVTLFAALICWLVLPKLSLHTNAKIIKAWSGIMLRLTGARLKVIANAETNYFQANTLIAANHLSWLDILVLYRIYFINFIGKVEMASWPILNHMVKAGGTIFIDRNRKKDLLKVNLMVSEYLIKGHCIGFFPEGAVGEGDVLLPFKASILEAAILAKSNLIPVVILYYRKDGSLARETSFGKNFNLFQSLINALKLNGFTAQVTVLDSINAANYSNREALNADLYHQINSKFMQR